MEKIKIPYGKENIEWTPPNGFQVEVINPKAYEGASNQEEEVVKALESPIGSKTIEEFKGVNKVAIAISDLTRPVPNKVIIPPIVEKLEKIGVKSKNIFVIVGTGLHRPSDKEEFIHLLGEEIVDKVTVISHDANNEELIVSCGVTSKGTPVEVNKYYAEADLKIVTGMIDPHQFIGFTGGAKGLAIGLGSKRLIQANHSMLTSENAQLGLLEGNPPREDIDEVGKIVGIDLIVNVILNNNKEIVKAVAGHFIKAHRRGVELAKDIFEVPIREKAEIAIVSPGGFPKDLNMYQAQKGLAHASRVVKDGGYIILTADCSEGIGDDKFYNTMKSFKTPEEVIEHFKSIEFEIGVHKAFLWCRTLSKINVYLISRGINDRDSCGLMVEKRESIEAVIEEIKHKLPEKPKVIVMPKANSTIPVVNK
nr:nickel-dependent lactate racemase [Desulfitibacter alkalitolerans]